MSSDRICRMDTRSARWNELSSEFEWREDVSRILMLNGIDQQEKYDKDIEQ